MMQDLLVELSDPTVDRVSSRTIAELTRDGNWAALCTRVSFAGLAPLAYERLRPHAHALPADVLEWLRREHQTTVEHNCLLLDELHRIGAHLDAGGVPSLVLKGPVLAHLTTGLYTRGFHDLDILVHRSNLKDADRLLRSLGFDEIRNPAPHDYHTIYGRKISTGVVLVEVHFDILDRGRGYVPDIEGIWSRAIETNISGYVVHAPALTDHLLLTMMQLPHHAWETRLLVDIRQLVCRWTRGIEWDQLMVRARAWGMWALVASTLYSVSATFHFALPELVREHAKPANYFQRIQWNLVKEMVSGQLYVRLEFPLSRITPFLVSDRPETILSLLRTRTVPAGDPAVAAGLGTRWVERVKLGTSSLPSLLRVLVKSGIAQP